MNDVFVERLIKRKITPFCMALRILCVLLIIGSVVLFVMYGSIGLILEVIVCYAAYYMFKYTSIEYEYCYVTGEFVIDKVLGKAKRKKCVKIDMSTVELVAPVGHEAIDEFANAQFVEKDFSSRFKVNKEYIMFFRKDTDLIKMTFEPDETIVKAMQMVAPRKVYI